MSSTPSDFSEENKSKIVCSQIKFWKEYKKNGELRLKFRLGKIVAIRAVIEVQ
jgi:hypothetical protein